MDNKPKLTVVIFNDAEHYKNLMNVSLNTAEIEYNKLMMIPYYNKFKQFNGEYDSLDDLQNILYELDQRVYISNCRKFLYAEIHYGNYSSGNYYTRKYTIGIVYTEPEFWELDYQNRFQLQLTGLEQLTGHTYTITITRNNIKNANQF